MSLFQASQSYFFFQKCTCILNNEINRINSSEGIMNIPKRPKYKKIKMWPPFM